MKGEVIKMLENHVGKGDSQNTTALIGNRISKILVWLASVVTLDHSSVVVCYWSTLNCSVVQCFAAKNKAGTWLVGFEINSAQ